jgi:nitrate reductase beta subunit
VLEKLRALHAEFKDITLDELLAQKNNHYVFRMRNGNRPYNFVNVFGDGIRAAKMLTNGRDKQERSLYSLRHYYATERLYEGVTYEQLSEQMGTSAKMLRDHYQHFDLLKMSDKFTGDMAIGANTDEILNIQKASQANMMNFLGVSTGIYLSVEQQNTEAKEELEQELLSKSKK